MPHLDVVNPYDLAPIGTVELCDWDRIDGYLDSACRLFKNKESWLPAHKRIDVLKKTAGIMASRSAELAFLIANEGGKPLVDARVEVARAIDGIDLCIKELLHHVGQEVPMGLTSASESRLAFSTREPLGIVVAVSAFNHPLNLIVHQVAPAVATGCPVLVKPADDTPLSCQLFVQILHEAGLPEEWCRYCPCELDTAQRLVVDPRIGFFSFVGSAKVGWMLRSKLAAGVRCSLEHGGAAPVIIDRDYDLAKILPKLVKGGYYHSGQVCVSVQRVYVPRDRLEEIADPLSAMVAALKVDNAIYAHTDCGPLIRPREVDRVAQWVSEAQQRGAADSFGRHRCHVGLLVVPERDLVNLAKIDFFPDPVFILAVADPVNLHVVDTNGVVLVEREVT